MGKSYQFTKRERLTKPPEFRNVMRKGRRITSRNFVVFIQKNDAPPHRLGVVVKKEIGRASFRNRMKRYVREFFRLHKHRLNGSYDIVVLMRTGCSLDAYREAEEELRRLFRV